jgi:hypothetical protein
MRFQPRGGSGFSRPTIRPTSFHGHACDRHISRTLAAFEDLCFEGCSPLRHQLTTLVTCRQRRRQADHSAAIYHAPGLSVAEGGSEHPATPSSMDMCNLLTMMGAKSCVSYLILRRGCGSRAGRVRGAYTSGPLLSGRLSSYDQLECGRCVQPLPFRVPFPAIPCNPTRAGETVTALSQRLKLEARLQCARCAARRRMAWSARR